MAVATIMRQAAADLLAARLETLGGPWSLPFVGVTIDEARQMNSDKVNSSLKPPPLCRFMRFAFVCPYCLLKNIVFSFG
jgi:hypothetical protein